jgi:hypothetical protein
MRLLTARGVGTPLCERLALNRDSAVEKGVEREA